MLGQMLHPPLRKDKRQQLEPPLINSWGQGSLDELYGVLAELTNRIHWWRSTATAADRCCATLALGPTRRCFPPFAVRYRRSPRPSSSAGVCRTGHHAGRQLPPCC